MPPSRLKTRVKIDHQRKGLDDRPERPERRLLVANLDVPPDQEIEQFTELPDLVQLQGDPSVLGRISMTCTGGPCWAGSSTVFI